MTKERPNEPSIFINGVKLFEGQAMSLRVAVEMFISDLLESGLGNDKHGIVMQKAYLQRLGEIRDLMFLNREKE